MIGNQKNGCDFIPSCPVSPSIAEAFEEVKTQVHYEGFKKYSHIQERALPIDPIYQEVCLIIAEMYIRNPEMQIKINGSLTKAQNIQSVYRSLGHAHIEFVVENFQNQTNRIYKKMAYIQTALYNSLFELSASETNETACMY